MLIVGGGPAGAIAGLVAARAGARVRILERATFPRDKLCGDTVNPGALALLRRLGVVEPLYARGLDVGGMVVTGENGVTIVGHYPNGLRGCAIVRRDLDAILLDAASRAGCEIAHGVVVRRAVMADDRAAPNGQRVAGVVVAASRAGRGERRMDASVVIGADGRRSALAFGLGLARHPARPRRWAVGAYFTGVAPGSDRGRTCVRPLSDPGATPAVSFCTLGEMHVRRNGYIGVAPVPGGLTNVCVVREASSAEGQFRAPAAGHRQLPRV